jgi:hypothetical protein
VDVEKHRTLLFAADMEGSRQMLGKCTVLPMDTQLGPAGTGVVLPSLDPPEEEQTGWRMTPAVGRSGGPGVWDGTPGLSRSIEAMIFPALDKLHTMVTWSGQNFAAFSTSWENYHSPLVNVSVRPAPTPVVDACGVVVGYYLKKVSTKFLFTNDAGEIFYASTLTASGPYNFQAESIVGRDLFIKAADTVERYSNDTKTTSQRHTTVGVGPGENAVTSTHVVGGYTYRIKADKWADLLLDIDGFVQVMDTYGDIKNKSKAQQYNDAIGSAPLVGWLMPKVPIMPDADCFGWDDDEQMDAYCAQQRGAFIGDSMMLFMDILSLGTSKIAKGLIGVGTRVGTRVGKAALRASRAVTVALTLEVRGPRLLKPAIAAADASKFGRVLLPDGRMAEAINLRVMKGYSKYTGVPAAHFNKMVEAAKEAKGIAVFRANKSAAIPLIEKGAHPKPKHYNAFKTSKDTGVLTATEQGHYDTVYQHGDFVVDADLVPRRTFIQNGKKVTVELKLNKPYWTIEKGQVIKPDGVPIVGDYDLLGFLPEESPGRNITVVPENHKVGDVKGDWTGPDVQRYQNAVNAKFDKPRVLHGAQDGFQHPKYGGLTDDAAAYAVYGDGSVVIMEGKQAQEAFYKAYNRQTAMGTHAQPAGVPVVDELAVRRARNAGR